MLFTFHQAEFIHHLGMTSPILAIYGEVIWGPLFFTQAIGIKIVLTGKLIIIWGEGAA